MNERLAVKIAKTILRWSLRPVDWNPEILANLTEEPTPPPPKGTVRRITFDNKNRRCTNFYTPEQLDEIVFSEMESQYSSLIWERDDLMKTNGEVALEFCKRIDEMEEENNKLKQRIKDLEKDGEN